MHTVSLVNCIRSGDKLNDNSCYFHLPNLLGMNKSIEIVMPLPDNPLFAPYRIHKGKNSGYNDL